MLDAITSPETPIQSNVAPNLDSELDAALSKSFNGRIKQSPDAPETKVNSEEPRNEIKKNPEPVKEDVKPESLKKTDKPVENEKPILTPDQVEKMDPKKQDGWTAIKNSNKRAHGMIEQRDAEISKLKATLAEKSSATQKELEGIKAKMSELEKYRAMVDIQADPEFVSKYDQPISKSIDGIKGMLKEMQVSDEVLSQIDFGNTKLLEQIVGHVSANRDEFVARKLKRKIEDLLDLTDKRNETLDEQKKNYKEHLEQKKKESFTKETESEGRMIRHLEAKAGEKDAEGKPLIPFLSRLEPKENATPAEIEQVNNHNNLVEVMGKKLQEVTRMKEPEQQAEIAIAAVASHYLMAQLKVVTQELNSARAELQKISAVNTEAPSRKPASSSRNGTTQGVDTDTALQNFFSRSR